MAHHAEGENETPDPTRPPDQEERADAQLQEEGEYLGSAVDLKISLGVTVLLLAYLAFVARRGWPADDPTRHSRPEQLPPYAVIAIAAMGLVILLIKLAEDASRPKRLRWDGRGLDYTPFWGKSRFFAWEQALLVSLPETKRTASRGTTEALLHLDRSRQLVLDPENESYAALLAALKAHHKVWKGVEPTVPEDQEAAWDGVHAPVTGVYRPAAFWEVVLGVVVGLLVGAFSFAVLSRLLAYLAAHLAWYPREWQAYTPWAALCGAIVVTEELIRRRLVRRVRFLQWERDGFWLGRYATLPRFYRWEEIESWRAPEGEPGRLTLRSGERLVLDSRAGGFAVLAAVLEQRAERPA